MKPETLQLLKNLAWGLGLLSVVGMLLSGTWHVVRLPFFTIDQVAVTGGETINHEAIVKQIEGQLEGAYWNFIPRRFLFTYPYQDIVTRLNQTPRVKDPIVTRQGRTVAVTLAEFEPVALWCDGAATTSSACVFLDENGYGFAAAPILTGGSFTRFTQVGVSATTSVVYTDSTDFAQLRTLEQLLQSGGFAVRRIALDQARDAYIELQRGGELRVSLRLTPAETYDNLLTVLGTDEYQHLTDGAFAYIDLRFGNKVFVNEFGTPEEAVEAKTATSSVESGQEIE